MKRNSTGTVFARAALVIGACSLLPGAALAVTTLTDSAVFSANGVGNNWNGWIWNTQGQPADGPDRWNMYYSTSPDPETPNFINSHNDDRTNISVEMNVGVYEFLVFGESVTTNLDPLQHFVLNLYFDGNQSAPGISALTGPDCPTVCAAGHPNGLDLFGNSGAQEAGTLSVTHAGRTIAVTQFDWKIGDGVDEVWSHWSNDAPYDHGSGTPDFVGRLQLTVTAVPLPASLPLLLVGFGMLSMAGRRATRTL